MAAVSQSTVCETNNFDVTITHSADPENLALYYSTNGSLTASQLYDFANHGTNSISTLSATISPAASTTSTVVSGLNIATDGSYTIYAVMANGNSNIIDPSCLPKTTVAITIENQPTAGTGSSAAICETSTTAISLFDLLTGEDTGGTWTAGGSNPAGGTFDAGGGTFDPTGASVGTLTFTYAFGAGVDCIADSEAV